MGMPSRGRRGCNSPATVFSAVVLLALTTWGTLLYRVFALPTAHPPSTSASCFSEERLMWSQRVVLTDHTLPAAIHVSADGRITAVHQHQSRHEAEIIAKRLGVRFEPWDAEAISPGVVDAYAHLGAVVEGTGRSWEGFASGTQAAAAGGVTTIIDLPAHSNPQTTTAAILRRKAAAARGKLHADVGFWGALVPENAEDPDTLLELLAQGALGLSTVIAMGMQPDTQAAAEPEHNWVTLGLPGLTAWGCSPALTHRVAARVHVRLQLGCIRDPCGPLTTTACGPMRPGCSRAPAASRPMHPRWAHSARSASPSSRRP